MEHEEGQCGTGTGGNVDAELGSQAMGCGCRDVRRVGL